MRQIKTDLEQMLLVRSLKTTGFFFFCPPSFSQEMCVGVAVSSSEMLIGDLQNT